MKSFNKFRILFIIILFVGIFLYLDFSQDNIIPKGDDNNILTQIISLILALTGLIGTVVTSYIAIRKERREQQMFDMSTKNKKLTGN